MKDIKVLRFKKNIYSFKDGKKTEDILKSQDINFNIMNNRNKNNHSKIGKNKYEILVNLNSYLLSSSSLI